MHLVADPLALIPAAIGEGVRAPARARVRAEAALVQAAVLVARRARAAWTAILPLGDVPARVFA